jgi:hypothetical protein
MYFGENVREIVSLSCGRDLRSARSRTPLPGIESPEVQKRLAANLERSFDIALSPDDVSHLTTVRAVLQCVRLRRWEREAAAHQASCSVAAPAAESPPTRTLRDRLVRYTPPTPLPVAMPPAASFAAPRKS